MGWIQRLRRARRQLGAARAPQTDTGDAGADAGLSELLGEAGAALLRSSRATSAVEVTLRDLARAYDRPDIRCFVLPTLVMIDDPRDAARTALFPVTSAALRLDQAGEVERALARATAEHPPPADVVQRLRAVEGSAPRFNSAVRLLGHMILTIGFGLVLDPIASALPIYAVLGLLVGVVVVYGPRVPTLALILPIAAAFGVTSLTIAVLAPLVGDDAIRLVTPALVSLLPGLTLTLAAVELTGNQVVAGASRLIYGGAQLGLLAFGLFAAITIFGAPAGAAPQSQLGAWAPWLGVALTALGYTLFSVAPKGAFPWIVVSLAVAYGAQLAGSHLVGAQLSGFVGAFVVIVFVALLRRLPAAPPSAVMLTCAYWLLVPGALGFIGLSQVAEGSRGGTDLLVQMLVSLLAIAIGMVVGAGLTRDTSTAWRAWRGSGDAPPR